jgi:hypothetical protein
VYIFNQRDKKWADVIYSSQEPHTETIKSSGCGVCSACMIVSNLTDTYIEPPEMAKYSVKNGFRIDGVGTAFALYPAIAEKYNLKYSQTNDIYKAVECVRNGGMVVCSTSGGKNKLFSTSGHLFVMSDCIGNDCEFLDPDFYSGKYSTEYRKSRCYTIQNKVYATINEAQKHITTFFCFERNYIKNIYSYDNTVEHLIRLGITNVENMGYWEKTLDGREPLDKDNVRALFDRLIAKVYNK